MGLYEQLLYFFTILVATDSCNIPCSSVER